MQNIQTQFLRKLKKVYQQMIDQNNNTIKRLLHQNNYMQNQYKIIQFTYIPENFDGINFNDYNPLSFNKNNFNRNLYKNGQFSNSRMKSLQESKMQRLEYKNIYHDDDIYKAQNYSYNQQQLIRVKILNQSLSNKQPQRKFPYRPFNGNLQDAPGNTYQLRLIPQFFKTYFLQKIQVNGLQSSMVNKKQLLALYVKWRLQKLPHQQKLKLVAIQINISSHIRNNYQKQCQTQRYCYSGMKFKSLDTIVEIMQINLKHHQKEQRKKKPKNKRKVLIKQQSKITNEHQQQEPNNEDTENDQ